MITFTLETNCLIDLDLNRHDACWLWHLIERHRKKEVSVAFVSVSASERQQGDIFLPTYTDFLKRLKDVGVSDIPQIAGLAYLGISYFERALNASEESIDLEREIHEALFPNLPFNLDEYATALSKAVDELSIEQYFKWRNAWCDRQMIWSHIHHDRDVFVTRDGNFRKRLKKCKRFEDIVVATPSEAASLR